MQTKEVINDIAQYAINKLKEHCGFIGSMANNESVAIHTRDKDGMGIKIDITTKKGDVP